MSTPACASSMLLHSGNQVWLGVGVGSTPCLDYLPPVRVPTLQQQQQQPAKKEKKKNNKAVCLSWKKTEWSFSNWGRQVRIGSSQESPGLWRVGRFCPPVAVSRLNVDLFCGSDVRILATEAHDDGKISAVAEEMMERKKGIRELEPVDGSFVEDGGESKAAKIGFQGTVGDRAVFVVSENLDARWRSDTEEEAASSIHILRDSDSQPDISGSVQNSIECSQSVNANLFAEEDCKSFDERSQRRQTRERGGHDGEKGRSIALPALSENVIAGEMAQHVLESDGETVSTRAAERNGSVYSHMSPQHATILSTEEEGKGAFEYYIPKVGDQVMGVVVSGNHSKLDIAIGAERLGHMFVSEMFPVDKRDLGENMWEIPEGDSLANGATPPLGQALTVKDEEVLSMGVHTHLPVELGTILTMDVKGQMANGAALLSARSVARRNAWNRVLQIKDRNEPIEIEITECNAAGLVSRIEGLRAFLPLYNFVKQPTGFPPECLKDYVGRRMWVQISTVHGKKSNLVVNEKQAWVSRNLRLGTIVDGTVAEVYTFGARVKIKDTDISGLLHISNIARAHIPQVEDVFDAGEQVKVMVVKAPSDCRIAFSTADLESEDGLMLTDRERVFREAEVMAKAYRDAHPAQEENFLQPVECLSDSDKPEKPIANWDWLEFGANPGTVTY